MGYEGFGEGDGIFSEERELAFGVLFRSNLFPGLQSFETSRVK